MGLLVAAVLGMSLTVQAAGGDPLIAKPGVAIVATEAGKLQGFIHNGIFTYRGVPYAKAERFMPPAKVEPWSGIRTALAYGCISPMIIGDSVAADEFFNAHRYWPQNDNCQNLNIWTPGIADGQKRPVMVWIHGGGFTNGSSIEQYAYDGENLSKKGDVVVVSVNHRLNVVGFLDLSAYGEKYKYSGNVGIMDLVAALSWIKANIAQFGGDPDNVTVFGQSGGGAKVLTLMAIPAAKGLFQKIIVESGASASRFAYSGEPLTIYHETIPGNDGSTRYLGYKFNDLKASRRIAELTLQGLGISPDRVDQLQTIPYNQLIEAANQALAQTVREQTVKGPFGVNVSIAWGPVMDGAYIPVQAADQTFAAQAKDIPLLIGSTLAEQNTIQSTDPAKLEADNKNDWSPAQVQTRLEHRYGANAAAVGKAFRKAYPEKQVADACFVDPLQRVGTLITAKLKADQGGAPVYNYVFAWESPVLGGIAMSYHCSEIPFVFDNINLAGTATGGGKAAYALADKVSQAWINFARNGNPNHQGLPFWAAYTRDSGATMIFDSTCVVGKSHDSELMSLLVPDYPKF